MHKGFLTLGALFGAVAVALGAMGAHQLKSMVSPDIVSTFQTGVQYQMYHTFALLIAAIIYERNPTVLVRWAGILYSFGILFFSGSLYIITFLHASDRVVPTAVGILTPIGGVMFIAGWVALLLAVIQKNNL